MAGDGAPGAAGPELQHVRDAVTLSRPQPHPQVVFLLQLRVEETALGLNAQPESEAVSWPGQQRLT